MKILHLDIETFPHLGYHWGLFKQNIAVNQIVESGKTASWAAKWHGESNLMYAGLNTHTERGMIEVIWKILDKADVVCHYNGARFDMPTLNKEFLKFGMAPPSPYQQIDLLQTARKQFRLASNKLDYVAQYVGVGKKVNHKGMELWTGCMEGNEEDWEVMEEYNKQDVSLLEELYLKLLPWIQGHPNPALFNEDTDMQCPKCGGKHLQKRGTYKTKVQMYQRYQCQDCFSWSRERFTMLPKDKRKQIINGVV
ncbi:MAG: putative DNA-directed DNA polymerase [Prokaryotic dsDNA virus sp.]|nr:MAG: putative DNA-directed DNA polymerase [Prokaryotic dsDNA virus sp.]|tara:strand:- start:18917 stop:19672 length:756 start_codon:yes stop_codon:yes gene_type:complete